jgi:enoyl-CoA hydratase/carnithine racemase
MGSVHYECKDHIGRIVLDNPEKRNAVDAGMAATLADVYEEIIKSDDVRVVIIRGEGDKAFCAGGYIPSYIANNVVGAEGTGERTVLPKPWRIYKPFIAAIEGYCVGGGFGLALTCDLRVASRNSILGPSGLKRGIVNGASQTSRLVRMVGLSNALEVLLLSKYMPAEDALRIGLVQKVVESGEVVDAAEEWARTIAGYSPDAVQATKRLAYDGLDLTWDQSLEWEDSVTIANYKTPDALEGYGSFMDGRSADFGGNTGGLEALELDSAWPETEPAVWRT